jgi:hypothetical protein
MTGFCAGRFDQADAHRSISTLMWEQHHVATSAFEQNWLFPVPHMGEKVPSKSGAIILLGWPLYWKSG